MTTQLDQLAHRSMPAPARVGQATAVEQSRAVAQVEAQVVVAMRFHRSVPAAIEAMRETCRNPRLADKAFFRYPRGKDANGKTIFVSGASVHLARELARVWGNFEYGIAELARDDQHGQSEMLAFAWDLQTNTRDSSAFINPHMRDKKGGPELLTDMRDIYESNANAGARRVREAIFAMLPTWFVEEAKDLCNKTLADGGGKPLAQRVADAVASFGNIGISAGRLEAKIGAPQPKWIEQDVATLSVIYRSIMRGEISKDEEFPPDRMTAADITGQSPQTPAAAAPDARKETAAAPPQQPPSGDPAAAAGPPPAAPPSNPGAKREAAAKPSTAGRGPSNQATERLGHLFRQVPLGDDADVAAFIAWITGHPAADPLTAADVKLLATTLEDALTAAQGDGAEAASQLWQQHARATGATGG